MLHPLESHPVMQGAEPFSAPGHGDLAALEVGGDEPVGEEMIEDVGRGLLLRDHVVQPEHDVLPPQAHLDARRPEPEHVAVAKPMRRRQPAAVAEQSRVDVIAAISGG